MVNLNDKASSENSEKENQQQPFLELIQEIKKIIDKSITNLEARDRTSNNMPSTAKDSIVEENPTTSFLKTELELEKKSSSNISMTINVPSISSELTDISSLFRNKEYNSHEHPCEVLYSCTSRKSNLEDKAQDENVTREVKRQQNNLWEQMNTSNRLSNDNVSNFQIPELPRVETERFPKFYVFGDYKPKPPSRFINLTSVDDKQQSSSNSLENIETITTNDSMDLNRPSTSFSSKKTLSVLTIYLPKIFCESESKHGMITKSLSDISASMYTSQVLFTDRITSEQIGSFENLNHCFLTTGAGITSEIAILSKRNTPLTFNIIKTKSQQSDKAVQFSVSDLKELRCEEVNEDAQLGNKWKTLQSTTEPAGDMSINLMKMIKPAETDMEDNQKSKKQRPDS